MKIKNRLISFEVLILFIKILLISASKLSNDENLNSNNSKEIANSQQEEKRGFSKNEDLSYAFNNVNANDTGIVAGDRGDSNKKMDAKVLSPFSSADTAISGPPRPPPNFSALGTTILNQGNNMKKKARVSKHFNTSARSGGGGVGGGFKYVSSNHANDEHQFGNSSSSSNDTNEDYVLRKQAVENVKVSFLEFDFVIEEFIEFESKSGLVNVDAKLKYKWWNNRNTQQQEMVQAQRSSIQGSDFDTSTTSTSTAAPVDSLPRIEFKSRNLLDFEISKQFKRMENYEEYFEKVGNKNPSAERLFSGSNKNAAKTSKTSNEMKKLRRRYSYLEQDVKLKFKCKYLNEELSEENEPREDYEDQVDVSLFPFDVHRCSLEFDLLANSRNNDSPIYLFPNTRSSESKFFNVNKIDYNKLVKQLSNETLFAQEWILKRLYIKYFNSTSTLQLPQYSNQKTNHTAAQDMAADDYIMSLALTGERLKTKRDANTNLLNNIQPAKISIDFLIYRRREPQIYLFVLPLVIMTLVTFLIFFLPTTKGGEKSLIALLNCAFLMVYNVYAFKMIVFTYDIVQIPLILKYSNCLMILQLAVLAYTCLVKSIYLNGFLTFSSRTYLNESEELYQQLTYSSNNDYDVELMKKCDSSLNINQQQHTYCVSKAAAVAAAANTASSESLMKHTDLNAVKTIEQQINAFGMIAGTTASGGNVTAFDESNYNTVYNNIDPVCDCSTTDELANVNQHHHSDELKNNEYGIISEYNKSSNQTTAVSDRETTKKSNLFLTALCCAASLIGKVKRCDEENSSKMQSNGKTATTDVFSATLDYEYASHLSRNTKMPSNGQTSTFKQIETNRNVHDINMPRNLSFVIKANQNPLLQPPLPPLPSRRPAVDHSTYVLNAHLKQLVKFEELHLKEKLIKEEWKRKARFCDGICCLFIFFILTACTICIFAILPTVKITSLID